jgi:lipoprotein NlpI
LNEAIRLDPDDAVAYYNRGNALGSKGDFDRASLEYDAALRREPGHPFARRASGQVNFLAGKYSAAASDMLRAAQQRPEDAYSVVWLYLARTRVGDGNAIAELEANAAKLKQAEWPYPVVELLLGRRTPESVMGAAKSASERCEAQFYAGHWHLLQGDRAPAIAALKIAFDTCPKDFAEYVGAQVELKRLGQ